MSEQYTIGQFKHMSLRSFAARTQLQWTIEPSGNVSFKITHSDGSEVTFNMPVETMEQLVKDWHNAIVREEKHHGYGKNTR